MKLKMFQGRRKFWMFLQPNLIFSAKSVNSRMGAGVGKLVRLAIKLKSYKSFIEFKYYSPYWLKKLKTRTRFKNTLKYTVFTKR